MRRALRPAITSGVIDGALLESLWTKDGTYVDPLVVAEGVDAIDATIAGAQEQFAGLTFRLGPGVDATTTWRGSPGSSHRPVVRRSWSDSTSPS